VEYCTAAEYYNQAWHLMYFEDQEEEQTPDELDFPVKKQLYQSLLKELAYTNIL